MALDVGAAYVTLLRGGDYQLHHLEAESVLLLLRFDLLSRVPLRITCQGIVPPCCVLLAPVADGGRGYEAK